MTISTASCGSSQLTQAGSLVLTEQAEGFCSDLHVCTSSIQTTSALNQECLGKSMLTHSEASCDKYRTDKQNQYNTLWPEEC